MTRTRNPEHDSTLLQLRDKMNIEKDMRVILLAEKSPDGIAIDWKNKKIYALEVLCRRFRKSGQYKGKYSERTRKEWKNDGGWTFAEKKRIYHMFDDVVFGVYYKDSHKRKFYIDSV